jgi:hypothetical protein
MAVPEVQSQFPGYKHVASAFAVDLVEFEFDPER